MAAPQYLYGDPRPVIAKFNTADATVTFTPGSLVLNSSGNIINMGTSTVTTNFVGCVAQTKPAGTTGTALRLTGNSTDGAIRVDTDGIFEFDRSDTIALNVGDPMTTNGTTANTLTKAGDESISIGRVAEETPATASGVVGRVKVKIQSVRFPAAKTT